MPISKKPIVEEFIKSAHRLEKLIWEKTRNGPWLLAFAGHEEQQNFMRIHNKRQLDFQKMLKLRMPLTFDGPCLCGSGLKLNECLPTCGVVVD